MWLRIIIFESVNNVLRIFLNKENGFSYKPIFEETVEAIIITDGLSEKIIDINKAGCVLFGGSKKELIGDYIYNFLRDGNFVESPNSISQITMFGSVLTNKMIKTKSGQLIPVDMTINTLSDDSGNYVMTTFRDVTEKINYEERIITMNRELELSNASKDKFFSIIAHDLRNPVSALICFSDLITNNKEDVTEDETRQFLDMIKNISKTTYELLDNLLNWAGVQTKKIEIQKSIFDLNLLVEKICEVIKPAADLKKVNIINTVAPGFQIFADENMINTIIRNLVSNSIKFSPKNSRITIKAGQNNNQYSIAVIDEGVGMEENYIKDLFKIDIYTSRKGTNNESGTGLGLILCNEFVKLHNGNIEVKSEINKGSEFIIQIPK